LSEASSKAKCAAVHAQNDREKAEQAAREEEFLASLWPSAVSKTERQWQPPKPIRSLDDLGNLAVAAYIDLSARAHLVPALLSVSAAADLLKR
jgi:hypothetical protein